MNPEILNSFQTPIRHLSTEDQGFRTFQVDRSDAVELPGLVEIFEVRLDGITIPPYSDHTVPTDSTHKNFKVVRMPNYIVQEGPGGMPILLRSLNSNDGKWQKGAFLNIKGSWKGDAPAPTPDDGLEALKQPDLRLRATELGLPDFPIVTANADIIAAIRAKQAA